MPNKKGSKVAASKARAQASAKKKARHGGPVLAAAAYVPPPPATEGDTTETGEAVDEATLSSTASPDTGTGSVAVAARAPAAAPARAPRGSSRERAHQAPPALSVSLRREVGLIGTLTVVAILVLVALRLFTDLGG